MMLRQWLALAGHCLLVAASAHGWDFSVSTSGNTIKVYVTGMDNRNGAQTCAGASVDLPSGGANCGVPGSSFATIDRHCNRIGPHTVFVDVSDASTNGYETRTAAVTVTDPPPLACGQFGFSTRSTIVLTHKYGPEEYPGGQTRDAQVDVLFRWINVDPGTPMYVKVFDAEDRSSYRTNAPAGEDNLDSAAGTLATSPSDTGAKELTFQVGSDPISTIYLNTTGFAAGDNYTIKASLDSNLLSDPSFVCNSANACREWWPVETWKRVYLEKKQMFRSGVFVAAPASAGSLEVLVQAPTGLRWNHVALRPGDAIRLLHAPRLDGLDFDPAFHFEDAVIEAVDRVPGARNQRLLTLAAPLTYSYSNDPSYPQALEHGVTDGVGNVAAGTYGRNEQYLHTSFAPAFVQFWTTPQAVQEIPYVPVVRMPAHLANKWFENTPVSLTTWARPGHSNVKHVLAGSGVLDPTTHQLRVSPYTFGETGLDVTNPPPTDAYIPRPNYSWTWVGGIERAVGMSGNPYRGLDPWIFNGENLVHELAHAFNVNSVFYYGTDFGHCSRTMAGNASMNCKMRSSEDLLHVPAQSGDGIIGFHYLSEADSEYMTIRRAMEPLATPIR